MIEIKEEFSFNIAHIIENKNLHGHSYKLIICANTIFNSVDKTVVNFDDFIDFVNKTILEKINNAFVYFKNTTDICEKEIANTLKANNRKIFACDFVPTTEKIAEYLFKCLNFNCVMENKDFRISLVELVESSNKSVVIKD